MSKQIGSDLYQARIEAKKKAQASKPKKSKQYNLNSYILWEGESLIDGGPIVAIATGFITPSKNKKARGQIQTYIMRSDMHPWEAIVRGNDVSVCEFCIKRGDVPNGIARDCYVVIGQDVANVYRAYKRGRYKRISANELSMLATKSVRLGSYGECGAVPFPIWESLIQHSAKHTGFTHLWHHPLGQPYKGIMQASCDTNAETQVARSLGWSTYTAVPVFADPPKDTIECPHQRLPEKEISCADCNLCDGTKNIWIFDHGIKHKIRLNH